MGEQSGLGEPELGSGLGLGPVDDWHGFPNPPHDGLGFGVCDGPGVLHPRPLPNGPQLFDGLGFGLPLQNAARPGGQVQFLNWPGLQIFGFLGCALA